MPKLVLTAVFTASILATSYVVPLITEPIPKWAESGAEAFAKALGTPEIDGTIKVSGDKIVFIPAFRDPQHPQIEALVHLKEFDMQAGPLLSALLGLAYPDGVTGSGQLHTAVED